MISFCYMTIIPEDKPYDIIWFHIYMTIIPQINSMICCYCSILRLALYMLSFVVSHNPLYTGYTCTCNDGFTGDHCDVNINECASWPCVHGTCTDDVDGYVCSCDDGYTDATCDVNIARLDSCSKHE